MPKISEHRPWRFVRILRDLLLNLWVHVTGDHEQIRVSVIIEVNDTRAPAHVAGFHGNSRGGCGIFEISFAVIVEENVSVVGEMGLKDVEMPIQIVIPNSESHAGLFHSVFA